ncbi:lactate dehydrogenase [Loktanella sp. 3ANDIMAR09]|uniref:DNA methyltransferase n=1 Tax=Loktanella sp. 3ANDIMAR09 TaxID=1225657 RepID=UPI0006FB3F06|nr:DNA methyltransferase [Loktanella sp. 3ANDIMAR09]KQI67664.1 lactate dehydrogenase [Loktanella sp. 3ANDIMAR09]
MNAVEIEQAVSELAEQPFDAAEFPYAFLMAFGNKDTTIKRLRTGASNKSDIGGILQTNNIHLATCAPGDIAATLTALRDSPATTRAKAKFILATDGIDLEAEDITTGETIACRYTDFPDHFGFFLPLAGISTVKQIRESAFDIRATSRLNRLYVELIKDNPDWGSAEKRHDMNHFMARLIFCFFAEDTDIFVSDNLFTATIDQMANRDGSNTHEVIGEIFRAMNTAIPKRAEAKLPRWADTFPYVNGGLFSGSTDVPRFSKIAQRYLSHIGSLDWTQINPDIFGSMIQAVADEEERSVLGMHYTSVPNILKVLNPLFLDDLRTELEAAGDNARKLANLRARMAKIRVFDPACGSGNFLVIAYKEMRALEYEINKRRGEPQRRTDIPLTNYRGIELRDFSAEIARLALIIAEYQCDVTYRGQKEALAEFLPLDAQNWITCGNALRLDWLSVCPPTGTGVKFQADDLFMQPADQAQIDFANEGGETYICGNPPYLGSQWRTTEQQEDMERVFAPIAKTYRDLDYVACWFAKAVQYGKFVDCKSAFVATKSVCQGIQVAMLWPFIFSSGAEIFFAHRPFTWQNLAKANAGVTVVIVGLSFAVSERKRLFDAENEMSVPNIGPYLIPMANTIVAKSSHSLNDLPEMDYGNKPSDGGELILSREDVQVLLEDFPEASVLVKKYVGAQEFTKSSHRYCLWIENDQVALAKAIPPIQRRLDSVREIRLSSKGLQSQSNADTPHRFVYAPHRQGKALIVPSITSSNREYLPCGFIDDSTVASNKCAVVYDAEPWLLGIVASSLHLQWIASVCVRMRNDFSYSNTLGWNTFPVPKLTEKNRADLTAAAEGILLAREAHFPATIADLYDPEKMPANLRAAHDHNDEVLERIYIGRRFRNDTERLEKLFEMYTRMTTKVSA